MANEEHVTLFKQDLTNWNKWRDNNPDIIPDLSEAVLAEYDFDNVNLSQANLRGVILSGPHSSNWDYYDYHYENIYSVNANFRASDLRNAKLDACYLPRANFSDADLRGAELCRSSLEAAQFCNANLSRTNLSKAWLKDADFSGANLYGADLNGANLNRTNFSGGCLEAVDFNGTDLSHANFSNTDLNRADLSRAKNLTEEQLKTSRLCKTKLPKGINLDSDRDCIVAS
jgi:uncharacterized protein YjbI with pentapeptide repeats